MSTPTPRWRRRRTTLGLAVIIATTFATAVTFTRLPLAAASVPDCSSTNWIPNANLVGCNLYALNLSGKNLTNANLTNAILEATDLTGATLTGATLTGATLTGATLTNVASGGIVGDPLNLPSTWRLTAGYLIGPNANLANANLVDANLVDANLFSANLTSANLSRADLTRGYLQSAALTGADLSGANLTDANFRLGNLTNVDLSNANARNANFDIATLIGADLSEADFTSAILSNTNLTGATLTSANFTDSLIASTKAGPSSMAFLYNASDGDNRGPLLTATYWEGTSPSPAVPTEILGRSVDAIGVSAFQFKTTIASINVGQVRTIGDLAFYGATSLTGSVTLPSSVTSIGAGAFLGTQITSINLESVTSFSDTIFYNVSTLAGPIMLNRAITSIPTGMFRGTSVTEVTFPETLTTISPEAFASRVIPGGVFTFEGPAPVSVAADAFSGADGVTVRYPEGAVGWADLRAADPSPFGLNVTWIEVPAPTPSPVPGPGPAPSPTTPSTTVPGTTSTPDPVVITNPVVPQGASSMTIGGQEVQVQREAQPRGRGATLSAGPVTMTMRSTTPSGQGVPLAPDGSLILARSGQVPIEASGLAPGSTVTQTLYSNPVDLGTATANGAGDLRTSPKIPATTPIGSHTLRIQGTTNTGSAFTLSIGVTVATPAVAMGATPILKATKTRGTNGSVVHASAKGVQARCLATFTSGGSTAKVLVSNKGTAQASLHPSPSRTNRNIVTMRVSGKGCAAVTVRATTTP